MIQIVIKEEKIVVSDEIFSSARDKSFVSTFISQRNNFLMHGRFGSDFHSSITPASVLRNHSSAIIYFYRSR